MRCLRSRPLCCQDTLVRSGSRGTVPVKQRWVWPRAWVGNCRSELSFHLLGEFYFHLAGSLLTRL